jgi:outer membrane protein
VLSNKSLIFAKKNVMKNLNLLLNIVLIAAIIVLFVLYANLKNGNGVGNSVENKASATVDTLEINKNNTGALKVAYINVDTLLASYKLAKDLENRLLEKQKRMEADLNRKNMELQKQAADFQKKVQTNSFLSLESAKAQEQELYEKQQKLLQLRDQMTQEILQEQQNLNNQLLDSVINFLKEFNETAGYSYIFNNNAFLIGDTAADITKTVVDALNDRYDKAKSVSKK